MAQCKGGGGGEGRRNRGFRHIFGSLPNRPCLEEVNNSRPKGCLSIYMIDWQFFSLRFQEQDAFFPKSSSRGLLGLNIMVT